MEAIGLNRTPDKLKLHERQMLFAACDSHLRQVVVILEPEWLIGVERFTEQRARMALESVNIRIGHILHPSPASPTANRDWAGTVTKQMVELNIWE